MTPDQALAEFLTQWDTKEKDGVVSFDEFVEYYNDVSARYAAHTHTARALRCLT
jgi:hypothetical protein